MELKTEIEQEQLIVKIMELDRLIKMSNEAKTIYEKVSARVSKLQVYSNSFNALVFGRTPFVST